MKESRVYVGVLLALCAIFFIGNDALSITDQVESNYALTAKEMLASGDYFSPRIYGSYWYDKPAFFYWELIAAFSLLGTSDFAARLFPGIFASFGVFLTYLFGRRIYDARTGFCAAAMLATSFAYWLVAKSVITDATLFVFLDGVLVFFYLGYTHDPQFYYASFVSAGLAVLTKGPVGIVLPGLIILAFLLIRRDLGELRRLPPRGIVLFFLVGGTWYTGMYAIHGADFIGSFFGVHNYLRATVPEHPAWNVWYFYIAIFLVGFFPWSIALLVPLVQRLRRGLGNLSETTIFLLVWGIGINVFFQLVATKYSTYTLPALMPFALLTAHLLRAHIRPLRVLLTAAALLYCGLTALLLAPIDAAGGRLAAALDVPGQSGYRAFDLFSGKWQAEFLKKHTAPDDLIVSCGEYQTSVVYYADRTIYNLVTPETYAGRMRGDVNWGRKYVMPILTLDQLPTGRDIYLLCDTRRNPANIPIDLSAWRLLAAQKHVEIYYRKATE